jgi:hypothetical protein
MSGGLTRVILDHILSFSILLHFETLATLDEQAQGTVFWKTYTHTLQHMYKAQR